MFISGQSDLLVKETGVTREKHRPATSHDLPQVTDKLYHMLYNNNTCNNNFYFPNQVSKGAFTFNSHDCLTYIKQHMTAKSVHIKD